MPTDDLTPDERLRLQNELTKAQMESEHGAFFGFGENADGAFTPEMEAQFLQRIMAIEGGGPETYVPIGDFLSRKVAKQATAMAKARQFERANKLLLETFMKAGVYTEQPEWMTDAGFYRFLTTDFLEHTIPAPPEQTAIDGDPQKRHVIAVMYDQVRSDSPNHMATVTTQFLEDLLDPAAPFTGELLAHTCRDGAEAVPKAQALQKIRQWKEQWTKIVPVGFGTGKPLKGPDGAVYFNFGCEYRVTDRDGVEHTFDGPGLSQLALEGKAFRVVGFSMEGFEM